jgi:rod shape-determining protein MreC
MFKRPQYYVLACAIVSAVIVLNLPGPIVSRLKLAVGSLFVPLFGLANSAQELGRQGSGKLLTRGALQRENEQLKRENQELRLQAARAAAIERENNRLRQLVGWQQQRPWRLKLANVVLREPSNWWRTVQIDLGTRDGMVENLPVLSPDGFLVGRIGSTSLTRSQVLLVGDPNCRVSARIENEARDTGVIGSAGPLGVELVEISYLSRNALLRPGQEVVTSGLGGVFPKDVPIGKVVDARTEDFGFRTVARIRLGANLAALDDVWILLSK